MCYSILGIVNHNYLQERYSKMASDSIKALIENFNQNLQAKALELKALLHEGDLRQFENQLNQETTDLYNQLAQTLIEEVAQKPDTAQKAQRIAQKKV